MGSATMTVETSTDGATTLSRMNLSGYVGHVTIFSWMFTIAWRFVVGLGLGLGLDLGSSWLVVTHTYLYYFRLSFRSMWWCANVGQRRTDISQLSERLSSRRRLHLDHHRAPASTYPLQRHKHRPRATRQLRLGLHRGTLVCAGTEQYCYYYYYYYYYYYKWKD